MGATRRRPPKKCKAAQVADCFGLAGGGGGTMARRASGLAAQPGVAMAGFDPARTTVAELARWKTELPSGLRRGFFQAVPAPFVEILRCVKDEDELALMAEAALVGCKLFEQILSVLRPGIAERLKWPRSWNTRRG